ncbi:energy transducer TonB [Desulfothermus sp.]
MLWKNSVIDTTGSVLVTVKINPDGRVQDIVLNSILGDGKLSNKVISLIKQGEPYVDVMRSFNLPLKFQLYFEVAESDERE